MWLFNDKAHGRSLPCIIMYIGLEFRRELTNPPLPDQDPYLICTYLVSSLHLIKDGTVVKGVICTILLLI